MNDNSTSRSPARRAPVTGLVVWLAAGFIMATATARGGDDPPAGTLYWTNGDNLPGTLLGATDSHLRWRSPVFAAPFSLDLNYLSSIRFARKEKAAKNEEPVRFVTRGGDVLYGQLVDVNDKHVVLSSRRHGRVQMRRSAVRSFRQLDNPALVYMGPTGREGWKTLSRARRISEWKADADGLLSTNVFGAELFRDLQLPEISEIDITLRWKGKPGFLVTFAARGAIRLSTEAVKLETWDDELVLQTLASDGEFVQLQTLTKKTKSIQLRLIWNQQTGELAAYARYGELLGKMKVTGDSGKGLSGLYIQNQGSDLTVARVRVSNWNGAAVADVVDGESCVHLVNGEIVYGQIRSYDKTGKSLVVAAAGGGERKVAFDQVASVYLGGDTAEAAAKPRMRLSYYDGARLQGTLKRVEGETISLQTTFCDGPLTSRLDGAGEVKFFTGRSPSADRSGDLIELGRTKLHGTLAPAGSALGWRPVGSTGASPLPADGPARIIRKVSGADEQPGKDDFTDVVYLRSGDIVPCRIDRIDASHLVVETVFAKATRIDHGHVKAIEFNSAPYLPASGFLGRGWAVTEKKQGAVERTDQQVVFHEPATLGHRDLLRGDDIQFDLRWNQNARAGMTISLFTRDAKGGATPSLLVYFVQQQMVVRGLQAGRRQNRALRRPTQFRKFRAKLRLSFKDNRLRVFVDKNQVFTRPLNSRDRAGKGIILTVQRIGGVARRADGRPQPKQSDLLTISNLQVRRSGGPFGAIQVNDEEKQLVLTVPRNRKRNPPTHVLVAKNGDLLRGRLVELTAESARFTSRLEDVVCPRKRLAGIIWLADQGEPPALPERREPTVQAIFTGGATFTFAVDKMVQDKIVGRHSVLGECSVPLDALRELHIGDPRDGPQAIAYSDWKLRPAKEPQFAGTAAGGTAMRGTGHGEALGVHSPLVGTAAEDFVADLLDGGKFRLSQHADKVVILDFWASWCGPCVTEMPKTIETAESYPKDKVILLAVNQQENTKRIREFLDNRGWQVTVALDRDGSVGRRFQVGAIPQTVIIAPGGKIERLLVGAHPRLQDEVKTVVERLVSEGPSPATDRAHRAE